MRNEERSRISPRTWSLKVFYVGLKHPARDDSEIISDSPTSSHFIECLREDRAGVMPSTAQHNPPTFKPDGQEQFLIRPKEAAPLLGINTARLYELLRTRQIPQIRIGRSIFIPLEALHSWIAAKQQIPD